MVSIIIPTFNAEKYLLRLLEKLKQQTVKNFELIIIDSSSKDKTVEIAKKYTVNIIVIPQNEFDHGGTRAKAAKLAKGDILVFLTQDALPYNEYTIENIVTPFFKDPKIGAAYGRQIPYEDTNLFGKHLRLFNYPEKGYIYSYKDKEKKGIKTAFLSDSFAAYRKEVLEKIGWFKNGLIVGEDIYAGARILKLGYKIVYISDAKVYHSHSYTVWQEFKRYFDIGVFHKCENWIIEEYGKAEGEGFKYIKSEFSYLLKNNEWQLLPEFFIRNLIKYLGYKLGYNYKKIPLRLVKLLSMHKNWWDKKDIIK